MHGSGTGVRQKLPELKGRRFNLLIWGSIIKNHLLYFFVSHRPSWIGGSFSLSLHGKNGGQISSARASASSYLGGRFGYFYFRFGAGAGKREEASEKVAGGRFFFENTVRGVSKEAGWGYRCRKNSERV